MKINLFLIINIFFSIQLFSQIGSTIPAERRVDWSIVGYERSPLNSFPDAKRVIHFPEPDSNPAINTKNILEKLNEAELKSCLTEIRFKEGIYKFSSPIFLTNKFNNIILRGEGSNKTVLKFTASSSKSGIYGIRIEGELFKLKNKYKIIAYDRNLKVITLSGKLSIAKPGYYFDIRANGESLLDLPESRVNIHGDFFGQIVEIAEIFSDSIKFRLVDDINILWEIINQNKLECYVELIRPATNIGLFDFKIEADEKNNGLGSNFIFRYSANCWAGRIESYNPPQVHFDIDRSSSVVINDCYIHHAQDYGKIPGAGYGVHVHSRSTNCLIENNIFEHLRHSMVVSLSANKNVFGYNFSTDQYSYPYKDLSDLNIHGYYPFANLFEGNIVERIQADSYWGSNGPYNTLFRNYITKNYFVIERTNNFNSLGNNIEPEFDESLFSLTEQDIEKPLKSASYYYEQKPNFLESFNWPPIDFSTKAENQFGKWSIPAEQRYYLLHNSEY